MKNHSCLLSTVAPFVRRLCTAAVEAAAAAGDMVASTRQFAESMRLYRRLSGLRATGGSVSQAINQYIREGRIVKKYELQRCIRELRKYGNYQHALEIIEWMENRKINFSCIDHALRVDLLAKTKGITAAENYFHSLPPSEQNRSTYGSLLNCYCKEKLVDKAQSLFKKMDELNVASTPLVFNNLMSLCMKMGQPENVPPLVEAMKERNIPRATFTYNVLMHSYACLNDIEAAERVLEEMKKEDDDKRNWTTYSNLAAIYVKARLFEKAWLALQKVEQMMDYRDRTAYHYLISLYAGSSNGSEVKRVWNSLRWALPETNNLSYLVMLQALANLDDIDGLRECFEEWESRCSYYDMRIANVVIKMYLRHNMIKEAELVFGNASKRTKGPLFNAREMFMGFFLKQRRIDLALKYMEANVSQVEDSEWRKWRPGLETVRAFMKHFEEEKDVHAAEEFCKVLKRVSGLDSNDYGLLLLIYSAAGRMAPDMRQRIEEDGVELTDELENLLETVCPR